ncbi:MAG: hypothetical protein EOR97_28160 [Mesorhizobium sp.]|uniref:glycosyl hydrolase family 28-related protein n=1 Tax=Mesorhizobium sp. TaxID=1871066 RepID=UPI000FE504E5|nr:glycosyl hydrolase family 28-related protein [Mesorhizobium sp.]RWN26520.1 MAG: hypothetical protein EOR97_28160 [Mesorhizobium sp.]
MTSIQIDLKDGLSSSTAIKGPCRVATTANITLVGEQTIDGVAVVTDDRVLVKDQTTASDNGIWICDTGNWRRAKDFNKTRDVKTGTVIVVTGGTVGSGLWKVTTPDPISVGSTSIAFAQPTAPAGTLLNTQTGTGAVSRTIQNKFTEILSVKDFGAVGDGVTDDSAAIQLAETTRAAVGGELIFPPGSYLYDGQTINRSTGGGWRGIGEAKLIPSANNTIMMDVTGAVISANSPIPFRAEGLHFAANGKTGVTCYRESSPYYTSLSRLSFTGALAYCAIFTGSAAASQTGWINIDDIHQRGAGTWVFQSADDTKYIFNVNITNFNQQGTGAAVWTDQKMFKLRRAVSVYLNNVNVASLDGGADGVYMEGDCQGVFLNNVIIGWPIVGVHAIQGTDTLIPSYVYLVNCGFDQATVAGLDIAGRTWRIHNSNSTNGYLRGSTSASLRIRATATDIVVRDFLAAYMNHDGIKVDVGATKVILAGITAENNNQNAGGNFEVNLTSCLRKDVIMEGRNYIGAAGVNATGQRVVNGKSSEAVSFNVTPASTTAVTAAEDLMTYSIPAASLAIGRRIRVKAWGTTAANANTKTGRVFFGSTSMGGWSSTLNGVGWEVSAEILITGAATQTYFRKTVGASSISQVLPGTAAEAISGAIVAKFQGQNGTASAGDITCNGLEIEILD